MQKKCKKSVKQVLILNFKVRQFRAVRPCLILGWIGWTKTKLYIVLILLSLNFSATCSTLQNKTTHCGWKWVAGDRKKANLSFFFSIIFYQSHLSQRWIWSLMAPWLWELQSKGTILIYRYSRRKKRWWIPKNFWKIWRLLKSQKKSSKRRATLNFWAWIWWKVDTQ